MNRLRNKPFRHINQQQAIDAALIFFIIVMTVAYKLCYMPPVH